MRDRRPYLGILLAIAASLALVVAALVAAAKANHFGWPAWVGACLGAVLAVIAACSRKVLDVIIERPLAGLRRFLNHNAALRDVPGYRHRVEDSTDRFTLNVHPAIPLPAHAPASLSDEFPLYVIRDIDGDVRTWIRTRSPGSCLVLLVGPAAAGKTRLLNEALRAELPSWQMLRPSSPQVNALVKSGVDLSQSVLWLDDLQTFFTGEPLRVTSVEALLACQHGPVVLAMTIRGEERERLLSKIATGAREMDVDANAILRMPARWSGRIGGSERAARFDLEDRFTSVELARAQTLASADPRIFAALRASRDGDLAAVLACETGLVDRWRGDGDRIGQAVVTAAIVARRCGHPEPIPAAVIGTVALTYLSGHGAAPEESDWLLAALNWASAPILSSGEIAAIRAFRTAPGVVDGYQVSDILVQKSQDHDYSNVLALLADEEIWRQVLDQASPSAVVDIALSAYNARKLSVAEKAWLLAARKNDVQAARRLGLLYWEQNRNSEAEQWLRKAVALGSATAMTALGNWLLHNNQADEAERLLQRAANLGDSGAMRILGLQFGGRDDERAAEYWTRKAAESGNAVAMANLGWWLARRDEYEEAEQWGLKSAELGFPGAMENLGQLYQDLGNIESAMTWYRQAAEQGYAAVLANPGSFHPWPGESGDDGISNAILQVANLLNREGEAAEAEAWYRRGAELGDARSAAALTAIFEERGDADLVAVWSRRAGELARANLARNGTAIRTAYGEAVVLRHAAIMAAYADYLQRQGYETEARTWYLQAANFGLTTAA